MVATSCAVTIFEGPDGGGKTTAALAYAEATDACYVHHGPYPELDPVALAATYAASLLPAVRGEAPVVLDRSWLSEPVYGAALRGGADRIGVGRRRALERLALRCGAIVALAYPAWETVLASYRVRRGAELPASEAQLRGVYLGYGLLGGAMGLTTLTYDRDWESPADLVRRLTALGRPTCHGLGAASAGNLDAAVLLVGEGFNVQRPDPVCYRWPFGALDDVGCSAWLAGQLERAGVPEDQLCWVNADQPDVALRALANGRRLVVALGQAADARLTALGVRHGAVPHPQHHKRFHHAEPYPLAQLLKDRVR